MRYNVAPLHKASVRCHLVALSVQSTAISLIDTVIIVIILALLVSTAIIRLYNGLVHSCIELFFRFYGGTLLLYLHKVLPDGHIQIRLPIRPFHDMCLQNLSVLRGRLATATLRPNYLLVKARLFHLQTCSLKRAIAPSLLLWHLQVIGSFNANILGCVSS